RTVLQRSNRLLFQRMSISATIMAKVALVETVQLYQRLFQKRKAERFERNLLYVHQCAFRMEYDRIKSKQKLRRWRFQQGYELNDTLGAQSSYTKHIPHDTRTWEDHWSTVSS
ncbi:PIPO, partial [Hordeum mosaic virus]|uniref:PIPO n=1 Tax=Hordeum mosaic virus TaxID=41764 RepID=UPI00026512E9